MHNMKFVMDLTRSLVAPSAGAGAKPAIGNYVQNHEIS